MSTVARLAGKVARGDARDLARFTKEAERFVATLGEMKGATITPDQVRAAEAFSESVTRGDGDPAMLKGMLVEQGFLPAGTKLDAQRIFDWYAPMYRIVLAEETATFTPEVAAYVVQRNFDPFGEFGEMMRGMGITEGSKDFTLLNRIQLGLFSVLGGLRATGPWRAISAEQTWGDPPATQLGRQHAAWRAAR